MAALRFAFAQRFLTTAMTGIFEERLLEDDYKALTTYRERRPEERTALEAAGKVATLLGRRWLPAHYQWLEERWRA